jgi:hypothetical protein
MDTYTDRLPPILQKATDDVWYFLLATKDGRQFVFSRAIVDDGTWVHLLPLDESMTGGDLTFDGPADNPYYINERGVDVRLDAIAWVACGTS